MDVWKPYRIRDGLHVVLTALVCLSALGCSEKPTLPETYPVQGKVLFSDGKAIPGGTVVFQPQNDTTVSTTGTVASDGTFTLYSFKAGVRAPGAIAGPHRVIVISPMDRNQRQIFPSVTFPTPVTIQPQNNELTLALP